VSDSALLQYAVDLALPRLVTIAEAPARNERPAEPLTSVNASVRGPLQAPGASFRMFREKETDMSDDTSKIDPSVPLGRGGEKDRLVIIKRNNV
jgi:hypothetical protein